MRSRTASVDSWNSGGGGIRLAHPCDRASSTEPIERWSRWALAQADKIDPTIGGAFLESMRGEDET